MPNEGANEGVIFALSHTVLEGHRICGVKEGIKKGEFLLSWGLPFGIALRDIQLGIPVSHNQIHNTEPYCRRICEQHLLVSKHQREEVRF